MIEFYGNKYEEIVNDVVSAVMKKAGATVNDVDVEISLTDENEIRELNNESRGIDKVTDVLSFQNIEKIVLPFNKKDYKEDINFVSGAVILGEIFICDKRAVEQAEEYGHSVKREIAFLTCHGMLHLLGYDHQTPDDEKRMNELTEEILSSIGYDRDNCPPSRETEETNSDDDKEEFKSGFVTIMGRPNAGKSTLINTIVGEKVAIVSWKPQTTRNRILGIYNEKSCQIVFIDTPGLHKPRNVLGEYMMKSASVAADGADCILYVVDSEKGYDSTDKENILRYLNNGDKVVVAVNKTDHVTKEKVFEILTELGKLKKIEAIVPVSALRKKNIEPLISEIKKLLTDNVKYYDDDKYTDRNMRFMASEIIREKALRLLDKEVPYGIGVDVTRYEYRKDGRIIDIDADIICEKEAHKPIILGKNGSLIKKIATYSRQDLEEMTGDKIFLTLFVKVRSDWRGSTSIMKELGYDSKNPD